MNYENVKAKTFIHFPTDRQFTSYREHIQGTYKPSAVNVYRHQVSSNGTVALVVHASGLNLGYSAFGGKRPREEV